MNELKYKLTLTWKFMSTALQAYRHIAASDEFKERERMRSKARHDEAQALRNARMQEREKWQGVAEENEQLRLQLAELQAHLIKK